LAIENFAREAREILAALGFRKRERPSVGDFVLDNDAVWARENSRPEVKTPLLIKVPYLALCVMLDKIFDGRPISRFWFLESVARMPYFSYITMLQTYETFGWWDKSADQKRVHFAEEWNEFHHLLIMESLGGDQRWVDRFFGQHAAFAYYWVLVGLWVISPSWAYNFSELIEAHAVDTYAEFVDANAEKLKALPAPRAARAYYNGDCLYMFDEFQTGSAKRRPQVKTLYDVFSAIRDDEGAHVATMNACQDPNENVRSLNAEAAAGFALLSSMALTRLDVEQIQAFLDELPAEDAISAISTLSQNGVDSEILLALGRVIAEFLPFI
jgi:ubiquinol oxidase